MQASKKDTGARGREGKAAEGKPSGGPGPEGGFEREYALAAVIGGPGDAGHQFRSSLVGIAVGPGDRIHALGDGEVKVFEPGGLIARRWKAGDGAASIAVGPDGRVYVGRPGRVDVFSKDGAASGGFAAGTQGKPAAVTAIAVCGDAVLVADAAARRIHRHGPSGELLGAIGTALKTGGFMLPNRSLDVTIAADGAVFAADPGRHRVTAWTLDGAARGSWGRFGLERPEDFVGCCNPVNIAVTPGGEVVTAEKVAARVKVYRPDGKLLAVIGPGHFDPACTSLPVDVDSRGRIVVADPVRREVKVFAPAVKAGASEAPGKQRENP